MKKLILVLTLLAGFAQLAMPVTARAQATTASTLIVYE